eukprot:TRINITY_DN10385_c0_g1_i2.p1 TRINITY_DN10385_c0_g1~~TRINITY_DN10385_c0_g1_i2.p1  ORF type:complete len:564 (-),score=82.50 TRINITY_DN10385_c0_g1_i2:1053-2744(-)
MHTLVVTALHSPAGIAFVTGTQPPRGQRRRDSRLRGDCIGCACFLSSWRRCCSFFRPPSHDLMVAGFNRAAGGRANGPYRRVDGEHHGCPMYQHLDGSFWVYYWDDRDGEMWRGWWIGPIVGSETVCGYSPGPAASAPPSEGWRSPWNDQPDSSLKVALRSSSSGSKRSWFRWSPRSRVTNSVAEGDGCKAREQSAEEVPTWLASPGKPEVPLGPPQGPSSVQVCGICLEPLWSSRPSVFLFNNKRLCQHYFCKECAERVAGEALTTVQLLQEGVRLASVDGLSAVIDANGERLGELVWRVNGSRVVEAVLALVLAQLGRLEELQENMELMFSDGEAVVMRDDSHYGLLLSTVGRSLRHVTEDVFINDQLHGRVGGRADTFRTKYAVARLNDSTWTCPRCTMENSELHCIMCGSPPPAPDNPLQPSRPLSAVDVAALRSRFAVRPKMNWAVRLQCPLCRACGCAAVNVLPDIRTSPRAWFRLAAAAGSDTQLLSLGDLSRALAAILPASPDDLLATLEKWWERAQVQVRSQSGTAITLASFLVKDGPAHWAAQNLSLLETADS